MPPDATIIHSSMFAKYSIQRNSSFSVIWHLTLSVNACAVIIHSLIVIAQVDTLGAFSVVVKSLQTFVRSSSTQPPVTAVVCRGCEDCDDCEDGWVKRTGGGHEPWSWFLHEASPGQLQIKICVARLETPGPGLRRQAPCVWKWNAKLAAVCNYPNF